METYDIRTMVNAGWTVINRGSERDPMYFLVSSNRSEWHQISKEEYLAGKKALEDGVPMK
jgi:hypothetical protein